MSPERLFNQGNVIQVKKTASKRDTHVIKMDSLKN